MQPCPCSRGSRSSPGEERPCPRLSPASPPPQARSALTDCAVACSRRGLYAPLVPPRFWIPLPPSFLPSLRPRRQPYLFRAPQGLSPGRMKIQCDSCGVAAATVVCCADEAALCARCDVEVHAANRLASKHQRLPLDALGARLPRCDVCQEKAAFIFCVEDRALFCRDCDEPIHVPGTLSGNHQRYLATGIRVGLGSVSTCDGGADHGAGHDADHHAPPKTTSEHPPAQPAAPAPAPAQQVPSPPQFLPQSWAVDELLQFSDYESSDKLHKESPLGFKELEWFAADMELFHDQAAPPKGVRTAAQVPELFASQAAHDDDYYRPSKGAATAGVRQSKKARVEIPDDEDFFIVPDLG